MIRYLYTITFTDKNSVKHYDTTKLIGLINQHNEQSNIIHRVNANKLHSYLNNRYIPKYIQSIDRVKVRDYLNINEPKKRLNCKKNLHSVIAEECLGTIEK
jgi:predicted nucleic acid-binding protein